MKGMFKGMLSAIVVAASAAAPVYAADAPAAKPLTAQQQKMKDCSAEAKAKALRAEGRQAFMKTCLSGDGSPAAAEAPAAAAPAASNDFSQHQKMKDCNAEAGSKALKGDERKAFMKTCLSKDGSPATAEAPAAPNDFSQHQKMKDCNAEASAKSLKGDDRKSFMSTCLKG